MTRAPIIGVISGTHGLLRPEAAAVLRGCDAVIAGHSHQPSIEHRDDVLYPNPGSAGPRRFRLPIALATIRVRHAGLEPRIVELEPQRSSSSSSARSSAKRSSVSR